MFQSLRDTEYRHLFVAERLRSSIALQIRALRQQREMTQMQLGDAIGKAQTWISTLEDPEYGKMTVATLLRLAEAFDTDIEIKFRSFSQTLDSLPKQGPDYFKVESFEQEFGVAKAADITKVQSLVAGAGSRKLTLVSSAFASVPEGLQLAEKLRGSSSERADGAEVSAASGRRSSGNILFNVVDIPRKQSAGARSAGLEEQDGTSKGATRSSGVAI